MYLGNVTHARLMEDWAMEILRQYMREAGESLTAPVPILEIADRVYGLRCDFEGFRGVLEDASALTIPDKRWVMVNRRQGDERIRFTVAHELAHWLMEHEWRRSENDSLQCPVVLRSHVTKRREDVRKSRERRANYLAGSLLMPLALVLHEASSYTTLGPAEVSALAARFQVSPKAMRVRLEQLERDLCCSELPPLSPHDGPEKQLQRRILAETIDDARPRPGLIKVSYPVLDHDLYRKLKRHRRRHRPLYLVLDDARLLDAEALLELDCIDGFARLNDGYLDGVDPEVWADLPRPIALETLSCGTWYDRLIGSGQADAIGAFRAFAITLRADGSVQGRLEGILDVASRIETKGRLPHRKAASRFVREAQKAGKRVIIVTGCFDLMTSNHVRFLKRAKAFGDVLVVGLENDTRVRAFKGPLRPVNTVSQRLEVMNALACVDFAFVIGGSPKMPLREFYARLHGFIRADALAVTVNDPHMADRKYEIESAGGELLVLPQFDGNSSTSLLRRFLATVEFSDSVLVSKRHLEEFAKSRETKWRQLSLPLERLDEAT